MGYDRNNSDQDGRAGTADNGSENGSNGSGRGPFGGNGGLDSILDSSGSDGLGADSGNGDDVAGTIAGASSGGGDPSNDLENSGATDRGVGRGRKQRRDRYRKGAKREASGEGTGTAETTESQAGESAGNTEKPPNTLNFNDVLKNIGLDTSLSLDEAALSEALQFLFLGPAFMGWGDHWPLKKVQADTLSKAYCKAYESLDLKKNSIVAKIAEKGKDLLPFLAAGWVTYSVVAPRFSKTAAILNEKKQREEYDRLQAIFGQSQATGIPSNPQSNSGGNEGHGGVAAGEPPSASDYKRFVN